MAQIKLDREKKIELLRWLQSGVMDSVQVDVWAQEATSSLTDEELFSQLSEVERKLYPSTCQRLKKTGLCMDCNQRVGKQRPREEKAARN